MDHSWPNLFHFLQINHIHHQDSIYKNKITVRLLASYGLSNFVRMTIGTKSDMKEAVRVSNKFNV